MLGFYRWNESDGLYRNMLAKADSNKTGYNTNYIRREANYYLGLCLSRMNNLDEAIKYYEQAINICRSMDKLGEESPYYVFSVLGTGVIYDQKGNHTEAVKYYDTVLTMKDIENSKETAQKFKEKGIK